MLCTCTHILAVHIAEIYCGDWRDHLRQHNPARSLTFLSLFVCLFVRGSLHSQAVKWLAERKTANKVVRAALRNSTRARVNKLRRQQCFHRYQQHRSGPPRQHGKNKKIKQQAKKDGKNSFSGRIHQRARLSRASR